MKLRYFLASVLSSIILAFTWIALERASRGTNLATACQECNEGKRDRPLIG